MGNLLRLLSREGGDSCCSPPKYDVFVDFETAQPNSETDTLVYNEAERFLEEAKHILSLLKNYEAGKYSTFLTIMTKSYPSMNHAN